MPVRLAVALILISSTVSAQQPPSPETPPLRRWFEFDQAAIGTRYRVIENSAGTVTNNHLQHRQQFRAHFNADPKGRYALHAGVFTGGSFTSSWNNTGIGTGDPVANMRLKQLFAAAAPVTGVQGQVGSFYVNRGEHTEITTYDDDAYILGERIQVMRPKELWLDEVSFTNAHLGYLTEPNVSHRWSGFEDPNYRQFLVRKRFGPVAASADFTTVAGAHTVRAAAAVTVSPVIVRLETYRRVRLQPAGGFALTAERPVNRWLRASGGYTTIDPNYGGLNGDRYDRGRRLFGTATITFAPWLNLQIFGTHTVATDFPVPNRTRFDTVLTYNLLHTLRRTGVF